MALPIVLHGATGSWDELVCLILPATLIVGIGLALSRRERADTSTPDGPAGEPNGAAENDPEIRRGTDAGSERE